jgi:aminoglycoside phosphotransferase (APT) family kinase protein
VVRGRAGRVSSCDRRTPHTHHTLSRAPPRAAKGRSSLNLPPFPEITAEALARIAGRHGAAAADVTPMPEVGIFNRIFALGPRLVLRVPRDHPAFTGAARKEALAVPAARAAGVRTPDLVDFDDTLEILPVPYTVFERVDADTLGLLALDPALEAAAWRGLGSDLARLHGAVRREGPVAALELEGLPDPRGLPAEFAERGYFAAPEARWLEGWLSLLAAASGAGVEDRFLHGDTQATNVMVGREGRPYVAVIDWGASGWGDPAKDFLGMPLRAVPAALAGYREVGPLGGDDTAEARILWTQLQVALFTLTRGPQPGKSWGERPLGYLLDILRFLLETEDERWRALAPDRTRP